MPRAPHPESPWANVSPEQWNHWQWQQANRVRTLAELERVLVLSPEERQACEEASALFRMAITPYYLSLMDPTDPTDPIRRQAIPLPGEMHIQPSEMSDPMAEESHMPVPGITHRYPDRVLFYTTHNCPVYCRFCFRKRKVGDPTTQPDKKQLFAGVEYIREHPEVRDVLISGGDPLTFSDDRLAELLQALRSIEHLDVIRLATRNPVTLPQRITPALVEVLRSVGPIYVNTHFNHVNECTPEAAKALRLLVDGGCVVGNQMVLLKDINDDAAQVRELNRWLLRHGCRPYYIFQCDAAEGMSHFRTPLATGIQIIEQLRGWVSGLAVPHFVLDLPGGGGKVSLQPDYLIESQEKKHVFRNYAGKTYTYTE